MNSYNRQNIDYLTNVLYNIYKNSSEEDQIYLSDRINALYRSFNNQSIVMNDEYKPNAEEQKRLDLLQFYFGPDYKDILLNYHDAGCAILSDFITPQQNNMNISIYKVLKLYFNNSREIYPYKIITLNPILKETLVTIIIKGTPITTIIDSSKIKFSTTHIISMINNEYYACFICNKQSAIDISSINEGIIYFTDIKYNMKADINNEK